MLTPGSPSTVTEEALLNNKQRKDTTYLPTPGLSRELSVKTSYTVTSIETPELLDTIEVSIPLTAIKNTAPRAAEISSKLREEAVLPAGTRRNR